MNLFSLSLKYHVKKIINVVDHESMTVKLVFFFHKSGQNILYLMSGSNCDWAFCADEDTVCTSVRNVLFIVLIGTHKILSNTMWLFCIKIIVSRSFLWFTDLRRTTTATLSSSFSLLLQQCHLWPLWPLWHYEFTETSETDKRCWCWCGKWCRNARCVLTWGYRADYQSYMPFPLLQVDFDRSSIIRSFLR